MTNHHKVSTDISSSSTARDSDGFGGGKSSGDHRRASGCVVRDLKLNSRLASLVRTASPGLTEQQPVGSQAIHHAMRRPRIYRQTAGTGAKIKSCAGAWTAGRLTDL